MADSRSAASAAAAAGGAAADVRTAVDAGWVLVALTKPLSRGKGLDKGGRGSERSPRPPGARMTAGSERATSVAAAVGGAVAGDAGAEAGWRLVTSSEPSSVSTGTRVGHASSALSPGPPKGSLAATGPLGVRARVVGRGGVTGEASGDSGVALGSGVVDDEGCSDGGGCSCAVRGWSG